MGTNSGDRALQLVELPRKKPAARPLPLICRSNAAGKRKRNRRSRRNAKQRDALKRLGRHRGFSHGKA
jgi:hypothetical protein